MRIVFFLLLSILLLHLMGCRSYESGHALPFEDATPFSAGAGSFQVSDAWWESLEDDALNAAITTALENNFTLSSSFERLRAARALSRRQAANLWPELEAFGAGQANKARGPRAEASDSVLNAGLAASYEVDLWGRLNALRDAESLRAKAAQAFLETTALTLSADLGLTWYRLAGAEAQLRVLNEQLATNQTVLELLKERFNAGMIPSADVLRQRQLVEATREQVNEVEARIAVLIHLLATLQGRAPQDAMAPDGVRLIDLPPAPEPGLPAELLQRRPDVREAFYQICAADAELAAAISDRYPRINLSASLETSDAGDWQLFDDWLASLAGQLVAPVIDGGARRAEVARRHASLSQQVADYGQTVLDAFREVEDALALAYHQGIKIERLEAQQKLADETYRQLSTRYRNGATDYLDVLDALQEQQSLERELITARQLQIEYRVALHRALAGGFVLPAHNEEAAEY